MKIKNLTPSPMQLGDGRLIGASGANDERDYGLEELTARDRQRFERGALLVTKEPTANAEVPMTVPVEGVNMSDAARPKLNGGKSNVK